MNAKARILTTVLLAAVAGNAVAIPVEPPPLPNRTFEWNGICTLDCNPEGSTATAKLEVTSDYTPGENLDLNQLVSFQYDAPSTILDTPLNATGFKSLGANSGLPSTTGASSYLELDFWVGSVSHSFSTFANGGWLIGTTNTAGTLLSADDVGIGSSWNLNPTAAPAPAPLALVGLGLALMGWRRRSPM